MRGTYLIATRYRSAKKQWNLSKILKTPKTDPDSFTLCYASTPRPTHSNPSQSSITCTPLSIQRRSLNVRKSFVLAFQIQNKKLIVQTTNNNKSTWPIYFASLLVSPFDYNLIVSYFHFTYSYLTIILKVTRRRFE